MAFNDRLRLLILEQRRKRGAFTVADMAKELGISRQALYDLLNGRFNPSYEHLQKLYQLYPHLTAEWFLGK